MLQLVTVVQTHVCRRAVRGTPVSGECDGYRSGPAVSNAERLRPTRVWTATREGRGLNPTGVVQLALNGASSVVQSCGQPV